MRLVKDFKNNALNIYRREILLKTNEIFGVSFVSL
jgi:hypothetical protein